MEPENKIQFLKQVATPSFENGGEWKIEFAIVTYFHIDEKNTVQVSKFVINERNLHILKLSGINVDNYVFNELYDKHFKMLPIEFHDTFKEMFQFYSSKINL